MDYKKLLEKVKKGLECCSPYPKKCNTCPYLDKVGGSCNYLTTDSLEIINELSRELYEYGSNDKETKERILSTIKEGLSKYDDHYNIEKGSLIKWLKEILK